MLISVNITGIGIIAAHVRGLEIMSIRRPMYLYTNHPAISRQITLSRNCEPVAIMQLEYSVSLGWTNASIASEKSAGNDISAADKRNMARLCAGDVQSV